MATIGAGCDYQIERAVLGGIARYAMGVDEGSMGNGVVRWKSDRKWMLAARAGYLVTNSLMVYALAGVHGVNQQLTFVDLHGSAHPTGFVGGIGVEARLTQHVGFRLEGDWATASTTLSDGGYDAKLKPEAQTVRAEIVWHFVSMK